MVFLFFSLLLVLAIMAHKAGFSILVWSLIIFGVIAGLFLFFQYVREYEERNGKGSWTFDPFALARRSRTSRNGELRPSEIRRLKRIMKDLDFTDDEIDQYIKLIEEQSDFSLNELLLFEEDLRSTPRDSDGKIDSLKKKALISRFKRQLKGIDITSTSSTGDSEKEDPNPKKGGKKENKPKAAGGKKDNKPKAAGGKKENKCPSAAEVLSNAQPKCDITNAADLAEIDYQLFRQDRPSTQTSPCAKCVFGEFDSHEPENIVPTTIEGYTRLLLGEKQKAIDDIVNAVQSECFAKTGAKKVKARHVLADMFTTYFFGRARPKLPQHALNYLQNLENKDPTGFMQAMEKNSCKVNEQKLKAGHDDFTKAVAILYRTVHNSVESTKSPLLREGIAPGSASTSASASSSLTYDPFKYTPIDTTAPDSTGISSSSTSSSAAFPVTDLELAQAIQQIFESQGAEGQSRCNQCVVHLVEDMRRETRTESFFNVMRRLRHMPIAKSIFMVAFLRVYFSFFVKHCLESAENNKAKNKRIENNLYIYANKLVALLQLMWSVILQATVEEMM